MCPKCGAEWVSNELDGKLTAMPGGDMIEGEVLDAPPPKQADSDNRPNALDGIGTTLGGDQAPSTSERAKTSSGARYRIIEKIGEGGMGVVYKAEDTKLGRVVAIKRLLPKAEAQQKGLDRFMREANVVAKLNHINIIGIHDIERDNNGPFIVMEYVEGRSLEEIIESDGKVEEQRALGLFRQVCQAIGHAHRLGIIHRDIKPANILLTPDGIPKVLDFGLAQMATESDLSRTGYGMGTMHYMPPEQMRDAKNVDHRADIYALGATFYHMLTGERPKMIRPEKLPENLRAAVCKCIEDEPSNRYFSVAELLTDLDSAAEDKRSAVSRKEEEGACHSCGHINLESAKFCKKCGTGLFEKCPKCEGENRVGSEYCTSCGLNVIDFQKSQEHTQRAEEYLKDYKYSRAIKELKAALELEVGKTEMEALLSTAEQSLLSLNDHRKKAETFKQDKLYEEAEKEIQEAIQLDSTDDSLGLMADELDSLIQQKHLEIARAHRGKYRFEEAIKEFETVLDRNPKSGDAQDGRKEAWDTAEKIKSYLFKAKEHHRQKQYEAAITEYERILKLNPSHVESKAASGDCNKTLNEIDSLNSAVEKSLATKAFSEAIKSLKELLELTADSNSIEKLLKVAEHKRDSEAFRIRKCYEDSEIEILKAIELDPKDNQLREMERDIESLIQDRHLQAARALREEYKFEEAIVEYQAVIERKPDNEKARDSLEEASNILREIEDYLLRAEEHQELRRYQDAADEYEKVTELNPHHSVAHDKMCDCVDALALIELANEDVKEALSAKNFQKAIGSLEKLFELVEDRKPVKKKLDKLKKIQGKIESSLKKGQELFDDGHYREAVEEWQKVLAIDNKHQEALTFIGRAEDAIRKIRQKRKKKAVLAASIATIALALLISYKVWNHSKYTSYMAQAQNAVASENWIAASDFCDKALQHKPNGEKGLVLFAQISDRLKPSAEDARKETLIAKESAVESMARIYGGESLKKASEIEAQANSLFESQQYASATDAYRNATHEYTNTKRESLALMAEAKEEADRARSELERVKSGLDENKARYYAKKQYEATIQTEAQADKHYKKRNYILAKKAYGNANIKYKKIRASIIAKGMVRIPAGEFTMGSPSGEGDIDEHPRHKVHVDEFYMDKCEVTNEQYKKFCDATGRSYPSNPSWDENYFQGKSSYPVIRVNWNDASAYARWAKKRLPTEAEWEKACRAGTTTKYNTGNSISHDEANYDGTGGKDRWSNTSPVGSFAPNVWGMYDMHGNVWEWCSDWYDRSYYSRSPSSDPENQTNSQYRVIRGGSWDFSPDHVRSAKRLRDAPVNTRYYIGFRCAQDF